MHLLLLGTLAHSCTDDGNAGPVSERGRDAGGDALISRRKRSLVSITRRLQDMTDEKDQTHTIEDQKASSRKGQFLTR